MSLRVRGRHPLSLLAPASPLCLYLLSRDHPQPACCRSHTIRIVAPRLLSSPFDRFPAHPSKHKSMTSTEVRENRGMNKLRKIRHQAARSPYSGLTWSRLKMMQAQSDEELPSTWLIRYSQGFERGSLFRTWKSRRASGEENQIVSGYQVS